MNIRFFFLHCYTLFTNIGKLLIINVQKCPFCLPGFVQSRVWHTVFSFCISALSSGLILCFLWPWRIWGVLARCFVDHLSVLFRLNCFSLPGLGYDSWERITQAWHILLITSYQGHDVCIVISVILARTFVWGGAC